MDLKEEIEQKRDLLLVKVKQYELTYPYVLKVSKELDVMINQFTQKPSEMTK
ncbi:aspartyl-phosphate phosphatase Spo0E family protein [Lederbergia citri]|uniref:Aspartyl-phosphate phosphatase Spo0E family protein n=1 Tax=Lederbergia citri TaxID=2833580 RepID=A0A942TDC0_9BACI|nr:aspartyl-phosphate phosphatase Spo0E family protein [Lederbergia citri]MBS4195750.1 aspartyl-phosphate phosphatase Spo0E family protein [Lederbergia citri]